ncbi:MAG: histidine triad nucleotide-binding protein [Candidatus Eremiobacteraeota bacterium]|nr:histidine triad nucleotide-binding protein [Candidatus Eremiobacteraeota bacterium]
MNSKNEDCIFCNIVRKEIPAREVLRDEHVVAFHDLNPQAPTHVLVVPNLHAQNLSEFIAKASAAMKARLFAAAAEVGKRFERERKGFRVVINEGADGGQTVGHLHLHVLAGRHMQWPPG